MGAELMQQEEEEEEVETSRECYTASMPSYDHV